MSTDWDVESYRSEFESDEHWELRKTFMLAHKERIPEDEIVCLAQVFTNIEFLGCRCVIVYYYYYYRNIE